MKQLKIFKDLRSFLLLWGSQTVSELGTAMTDYAIIVWVYGQEGTASSVTTLTLCAFLPTILFRFAAGTLADRWNKKRIMLLSDLAAACGTAAVFALYSFHALRIWHLYLVNVVLSFMNAFQVPASFVATSMLVPKEHYTRVGGLQGFSGAAISILAPALGSLLLAFGGMKLVLACDLASFAVAFLVLLLLIRIPETNRDRAPTGEPFLKSCADGIRWLKSHRGLFRLTLFMAAVNFFAKLGNDGMLAPFVLGRTGNSQQVLGLAQSSVAVGCLAGSLLVTFMRPARNKVRVIFLGCAAVFSGNIVQSLTVRPWLWCAAAFASYLMAVVMNASLTAVMREQVPIRLQGRVFSARDTLQNGSIPLGLFLGGVLADRFFEPFMAADSPVRNALSPFFGSGSGAGIAVIFFLVGITGVMISLIRLTKPVYRELNTVGTENEPEGGNIRNDA